NDLPHLVSSWQHYRRQTHMPVGNFIGHQLSRQLAEQFPNNEHLKDEAGAERDYQDRTQQAFIVPKAEIAAQKYDLSINRYKEVVYQEES
ncbi:SAM-dependent DNA methyltransferase, partial [Aeromonas veronii]